MIVITFVPYELDHQTGTIFLDRVLFSSPFHRALAWVQARFVDTPGGTVTEADRLVRDVMAARGHNRNNMFPT